MSAAAAETTQTTRTTPVTSTVQGPRPATGRAGAVRVQPSSRPPARTWLGAVVPSTGHAPDPVPDRSPDPAPDPGDGRRPGRVTAAGRAWGVRADATLPDAVRWSAWFAVVLAEAVLGRRPATRLDGWVSPQVRADLARGQRLRPAEGLAVRPVLLSGRVQHPADGVAEASAVLRVGPRLLVLAFRLEAVEGTWVCPAFQVGMTPARRRPLRPAAASPRSLAAPAGAAPDPVGGTR